MATQVLEQNKIASPGKAQNIALWALQVLGAGMFLMAGFNKLSGDPMMVGLFDAIGIGQWFRYVTGGIELLSGLLLLTPRFAGIGAALLVPTMIGAILTHLFVIGGSFAIPAGLLVAMAIVAYGRREHTLQVFGRK